MRLSLSLSLSPSVCLFYLIAVEHKSKSERSGSPVEAGNLKAVRSEKKPG